jgi:putative beta-lysine N-acetyltransferase
MSFQKDEVIHLDGATLQHGKLNQRVYLMRVGTAAPAKLIIALDRLAHEHGYTKIFAKVPESMASLFLTAGYRIEASVPKLLQGTETACFLGRYFSADRQNPNHPDELKRVLTLARQKTGQTPPQISPPADFTLRQCTSGDLKEMSAIYSEVFPSYPFPIDDPAYLFETMCSHVAYFGVQHRDRLVALSSAEMNKKERSVEMTDFATLPRSRGQGLATWLLAHMEEVMRQAGFETAYTIARALSEGMNITFARMGYLFAGTLTNNTNISGKIESMNVWYKSLVV